VNVVTLAGNIRAPVEDEWNSSPEYSPGPPPSKAGKRGMKRKSPAVDGVDEKEDK